MTRLPGPDGNVGTIPLPSDCRFVPQGGATINVIIVLLPKGMQHYVVLPHTAIYLAFCDGSCRRGVLPSMSSLFFFWTRCRIVWCFYPQPFTWHFILLLLSMAMWPLLKQLSHRLVFLTKPFLPPGSSLSLARTLQVCVDQNTKDSLEREE